MTERPLTPTEERRLKMLLEATPNTWLALDDSHSRCVGRGKSIAEAVEEARKNGYEDPVMFLVPPDWTPARKNAARRKVLDDLAQAEIKDGIYDMLPAADADGPAAA